MLQLIPILKVILYLFWLYFVFVCFLFAFFVTENSAPGGQNLKFIEFLIS